jgi:predicted Zn-dependent protease
VSDIRRMASSAIPWLNQVNEAEADQWGCFDVLATGRARAATGLRWTEEGGLWLFDFFARLDGASGGTFRPDFLRTHPAPGLRIPLVQGDATLWHLQHPG